MQDRSRQVLPVGVTGLCQPNLLSSSQSIDGALKEIRIQKKTTFAAEPCPSVRHLSTCGTRCSRSGLNVSDTDSVKSEHGSWSDCFNRDLWTQNCHNQVKQILLWLEDAWIWTNVSVQITTRSMHCFHQGPAAWICFQFSCLKMMIIVQTVSFDRSFKISSETPAILE